ncbi:MAG: N-glycosylase/DNA lyase [Acidilobaceae archaeon]
MATVKVNMERVERVSQLLSNISLEAIVALEDSEDPQFRALKRLSAAIGKGWASVYALLTAVVSYKLSVRGEDWWECMADIIVSRRGGEPPASLDEVVSDLSWFIDNCRGSVIGREARKIRIRRVVEGMRGVLNELAWDPEYFYRSPESVVRAVAWVLGSEASRKTVAFTAKMVYYATREPGEVRVVKAKIPIPVDSRVACASYSSMVVDAWKYTDIIRKPKPAQEAWRMVSENTGIPILNLDTLLWLTGWAPRDLELLRAWDEVEKILSKVVSRRKAREIALNLYKLKCS